VTSIGTAGLGGRSAIIERNLTGGDCLNTGCVPSKALLKVAHEIRQIKKCADLGIEISG